MRNFLLFALLAASLGLNVWLALGRVSSRSAPNDARKGPGTVAAATGVRAAASTEKRTDDPPQPFVWKAGGNSDDDLRQLAANLRAAGFPPAVVAKIVGTMLHDRVDAKVAEMPFWQLNSNNREVRKMQLDAARELQRLQEEILGVSGSQLATLDPNTRRDRFGDLPDDKVAALLKIDRDYQDMASDLAPSGPIDMEQGKALGEQFRALEKERLADIKAALGPEAYAEYERQNSGAAAMVMRGLRDLKVTAEEYNALFAAQKARDPNESAMFSMSTVDPAKFAATYAFNDQVRAILGDERAHTYLKSADPTYGQVARFTEKYPNLTSAATYQLYQLSNESRAAMQTLAQRTDGQPIDGEKLRQAMTDLNARLETLLGSEVANAYRSQSIGSAFRFAVRPAPAANGTPAASGAATPPKG